MTEAELAAVRERARYRSRTVTRAAVDRDALLAHVAAQDRELFDARFQRDSARLSLKQVDEAYDAQAAEVARLRELLDRYLRDPCSSQAATTYTDLAALAQEVDRGE